MTAAPPDDAPAAPAAPAEAAEPQQTGPTVRGIPLLVLLRVTLFSAFVLVVEMVLFNVLLFEYDYYVATMGLGFVVFGIGVGSFAAS